MLRKSRFVIDTQIVRSLSSASEVICSFAVLESLKFCRITCSLYPELLFKRLLLFKLPCFPTCGLDVESWTIKYAKMVAMQLE